MRALGHIGDLRQHLFGTPAELHSEAAWVLTRSVPMDDTAVRTEFGIEPAPARRSFADLLGWMLDAGVLDAEHVGALAGRRPGNGR